MLDAGSWNLFPNDWNPPGCYLEPYTDSDLAMECFMRSSDHWPRELVFIGDSTARQVFWGTVRLLDGLNGKGDYSEYLSQRHSDFTVEIKTKKGHLVVMKFFWDPFFNDTGPAALTELYKKTQVNKPVDLVYTAVGTWFSRQMTFDTGMETNYKSALSRISSGYSELRPRVAPHSLYVAPVLNPFSPRLNEERKRTLLPDEVRALNNLIKHTFPDDTPTVFNELGKLYPDRSYDDMGMHFIDKLCMVQARLIMNRKCNAAIPRLVGPQACCSKQASGIATWTVLLALVAAGVGHIKWIESWTFKAVLCLVACYSVAHGIRVKRELGGSVDGVAITAGILAAVALYGSNIAVPLRKNVVKGFLLLVLLITSFAFRDPASLASGISTEVANWQFALIILEATSQQVRAGLQREDYMDKPGRVNVFIRELWELAKAILEQNLLLTVVLLVVSGTGAERSTFLRVFTSALHCRLHLTLFTTAAWLAGRVLRQYRSSTEELGHTVSLKALGGTMFVLKAFLFAVTFTVPVLMWKGLPFLDIVCLKFGVMGGMLSSGVNLSTASKNKAKVWNLVRLCLAALVGVEILKRLLPSTTSDWVWLDTLNTLHGFLHIVFVASFLTSFVVFEEGTELQLLPRPVGKLLASIGHLNWEFLLLSELVFFTSKGTGPTPTVPRFLVLSSSTFLPAELAQSTIILQSLLVGAGFAFFAHELRTASLEAISLMYAHLCRLVPVLGRNAQPQGMLSEGIPMSTKTVLPTYHDRNE